MNKLIAYAQSFASFIIVNLGKDAEKINKIILFGSASRDEATKASDVDIFIDIAGDEKFIESKIDSLLTDFYESIICTKFWHLMGINNEIKPIIGKLDKWKSLKQSIISNGIVLYGKYSESFKGKNKVLFSWSKIKSESKRVLLSKKIYGYNYAEKRYAGLIELLGGDKMASNCILVDVQQAKQFSEVFKDLKITPKRIYISLL